MGGDWYDVIPIPGGRVGLVMGDVAGKGLAAASMVGRLRSALRAYALEGHDPATALEQLNRLIWTEAGESQMATLLYAIVDPGDEATPMGQRGPHASAGGGAGRGGRAPGRRALGAARGAALPDVRGGAAPMRAGSSVVLYTDGLIERPGVVIDDGMALLAQAMRGSGPDLERLCDHVLATLVPDGDASDDVALLALRNVPMSDRIHSEFEAAPEALASMRGVLRRWLRHAGAGDQETAEIVTACGEAATNAIEHAGAAGDVPSRSPGTSRAGGRLDRSRSRRLALATAGTGARALTHASADGPGGGLSRSRRDYGAAAA